MIREITIKAAMNGYIAKVGCQTLVFESREKMIGELDAYLKDPNTVEKVYREHAINGKHTLDDPATAPASPPATPCPTACEATTCIDPRATVSGLR